MPIKPRRAVFYTVVFVSAVASFAVSQGQRVVAAPAMITPNTVFGVLATLLVAVVSLGRLFGSDQSVQEGWTFTHGLIAGIWALYIVAGLMLILVGFTGWVVLGNLTIAIVAGVTFWLFYNPV